MRRVFILVAAVVLVDTAFYAAIVPLLPHYEDELGLSQTAAGVLTASYAAGTLVASLPGGLLAARIGVRPPSSPAWPSWLGRASSSVTPRTRRCST